MSHRHMHIHVHTYTTSCSICYIEVDPPRGFIRALSDLVFQPAGRLATPITNQAWGTGLIADNPTMRQIVLGYILSVTLIIYRHWASG